MILAEVKDMIRQEQLDLGGQPILDAIPILHNPDRIILQMTGWSINLNADGTWYWEATDGG